MLPLSKGRALCNVSPLEVVLSGNVSCPGWCLGKQALVSKKSSLGPLCTSYKLILHNRDKFLGGLNPKPTLPSTNLFSPSRRPWQENGVGGQDRDPSLACSHDTSLPFDVQRVLNDNDKIACQSLLSLCSMFWKVHFGAFLQIIILHPFLIVVSLRFDP